MQQAYTRSGHLVSPETKVFLLTGYSRVAAASLFDTRGIPVRILQVSTVHATESREAIRHQERGSGIGRHDRPAMSHLYIY